MSPLLQILANDGRALLYRPELRPMCGSVNATILFSRILYWYARMEGKPFYKFKEPCSHHKKYNPGDSWIEELGFSREEFDSALSKIGFRIESKHQKLDGDDLVQVQQSEGSAFVHYWTDGGRLTHYQINEIRVEEALDELFGKKEKKPEPLKPVSEAPLPENSMSEAVEIDEQVAWQIREEIRWRMKNEFPRSETISLFGEDAELPAEVEYLADVWLEIQGKTLIPHPKSGRANDRAYQNDLKGFKNWVKEHAKSRKNTPPTSRVMTTPNKQFDHDKQALLTTCKAWGRVSWRLAHPERAARGLEWEIDENKIVAFLKIPGYTVEQKQAYLCYNAIKRPGLRYRDLDEVFRDGIDSEEMNKALTLYDRSIWLGRPWNFSKYPPEYPAPYLQMPYYTSESFKADIPENFFVEHDKLHPPTWLHDSEGNPIKK